MRRRSSGPGRAAAAIISILFSAGFSAGCGYVGAPLPPALNLPVRVTDLTAVERGSSLVIRFTIPKVTTEDLPVRGADIELRIGAAGTDGFRQEIWEKSSYRVPAVPRDQPVAEVRIPVTQFVGQTVVIGVNVHGPHGRSAGWSVFQTVPVVSPLARPEALAASNAPDAIQLEWHAAAGEFRVFRKTPEVSEPALLGSPTRPSWTDSAIEYGKTYEYFVQAVEKTGKTGETYAESDPSATVAFKPEDKSPPGVPAGLNAIAGARSIELVWERNTEKDFASYTVFRNGQKLADGLTAPSYSDRDVKTGTKYQYQISAFDTAGNESARSAAVETEIP